MLLLGLLHLLKAHFPNLLRCILQVSWRLYTTTFDLKHVSCSLGALLPGSITSLELSHFQWSYCSHTAASLVSWTTKRPMYGWQGSTCIRDTFLSMFSIPDLGSAFVWYCKWPQVHPIQSFCPYVNHYIE